MFDLRQRLQGYEKARNQAVEKEAPNAIDEFGAADELDDKSELDTDGVFLMDDALEDLRARHLPFKRPEKCDECSLDELRLQILTEVTASSQLENYYREAWGVGYATDSPLDMMLFEEPSADVRRIAVMQIELMVRAFAVLQLQRFGNAPENRGWMVLFRAWGRSSRFQRVFNELKPTLAPEFVGFYELYLHNLPRNASLHRSMPVHHPWLKPKKSRGVGFFMDSGIVEGEIEVEVRPGKGDAGSEGPDQTYEKPSGSGDQGGGQPAPNA